LILPPERIVRLTGYGMRSAADGYLYRPTNVDEVRAVFDLARQTGRQVVLRGAGRSYGDANIGRECLILDLTRMNRILAWDKGTGEIDCEAGVTIENLWRYTLEDGFWPPVVSGTMYPTLGGALAMNIHGKNNFRVGTLGEHVEAIDVLWPTGELETLTREDQRFFAVIGGAGLLGVIVRVRLGLKKIHSGNLRVLAVECRDWDEQFAVFEEHEPSADYLVSWVDCFGRGRGVGRGQIHAAWYLDEPGAASLRPDHQDLPDTILNLVPKSMVWRFLKPLNNRAGMRFINWAKHTAGIAIGNGKIHPQSLVAFSFLLDYVPNWRKAYGEGGFIQYQTFVPKDHARRVFAEQVAMQQAEGLEAFLGVFKRHRPDPFLLSHAVDGYSFALDFKVTRRNWSRLEALCHGMNDLVLAAGGRFYLAKDSTLRPSDVETYLGPALAKFRQIKEEVDPDHLLTSDLATRLNLIPHRSLPKT
jgi:decaprenylphospho-beta-D-ribofuranose 2-oxidase